MTRATESHRQARQTRSGGTQGAACPRCAGFLKTNRDIYGPYVECVQCGYMGDTRPGREPDTAESCGSKATYGIEIERWTWKRAVAMGGRGKRFWQAEIAITYSVERMRGGHQTACVMDIEGWPYDRWAATANHPMQRIRHDFSATTGMLLSGLPDAVRERAPTPRRRDGHRRQACQVEPPQTGRPLQAQCLNGHERSEQNTYEYVDARGIVTRICRVCKREKARDQRMWRKEPALSERKAV